MRIDVVRGQVTARISLPYVSSEWAPRLGLVGAEIEGVALVGVLGNGLSNEMG